jgi:hypothetical protein
MSDGDEMSAASRGSHAELTGRLAESIGADPALTQSIRIDVSVRKEPTVHVTRLADADQIGRIIECSTWANYTLVENDEQKRLRAEVSRLRLNDAEREAVEWAVSRATYESMTLVASRDAYRRSCALRGVLERLG